MVWCAGGGFHHWPSAATPRALLAGAAGAAACGCTLHTRAGWGGGARRAARRLAWGGRPDTRVNGARAKAVVARLHPWGVSTLAVSVADVETDVGEKKEKKKNSAPPPESSYEALPCQRDALTDVPRLCHHSRTRSQCVWEQLLRVTDVT